MWEEKKDKTKKGQVSKLIGLRVKVESMKKKEKQSESVDVIFLLIILN